MADQSVTIALGERAWQVKRARLGGFLRLQQARESINRGIQNADNGSIVDGLLEFLRVCIPDLEAKDFHSAPWWEVFVAYVAVERLNRLPHAAEFAILRFPSDSHRTVPWDNPLRSVILWIHLIASTYSWAKDQIEQLWPEEAVAYVQEILADKQEQREFFHSLSEVAYRYNKATKKSTYKPLTRPAWMVMRSKGGDLVTVIRADMVPVGNVIYPTKAGEELRPHAR